MNLKKEIRLSKKKASPKQLPRKRTINFAVVGVKKTNVPLAVVSVLLVALIIGGLCKYVVIDRLAAAVVKNAEVAAAERQLAQMQAQLDSFGEISGEYNAYTYSGLTAKEIHLVDMRDIEALMEKDVMPYCLVMGWTVANNTATVPVTGITLDEANAIIQILLQEEMVNYASLTSATTDQATAGEGGKVLSASGKGQDAIINIVIIFNDQSAEKYGLSDDDYREQITEVEE